MPQFAVADTSSAAASLLNGLNAAANQHAQLLRQQQLDQAAQAQQSLKDRMEAYAAGAVDVPLSAQAPAPLPEGRPTLLTGGYQADTAGTGTNPTPTPYTMDPSRTMNVGGKQMNFPTQSQKDLASGKTYIPAGLMADLHRANGWDGKTPVTQSQSHELAMAVNEAQPKDEPSHIDVSGKFLGPDGNPAPVIIGDRTGKVRMLDLSGVSSSPGASPDGPFNTSQSAAPQAQVGDTSPMPDGSPGYGFHAPANGASPNGPFTFAAPQKAEKPDTNQVVPGYQGPNGGLLTRDTKSNTVSEVPLPAGSKPVMTAAQTEADKDRDEARRLRQDIRADAQDAKQQGVRDTAQKQIDILQTRQQEQDSLREAYGRALVQPDSESKDANGAKVTVIDPGTGREEFMTPARRADFEARYDKATALRDSYHGQWTKLIKRHGGDAGIETYTPDAPRGQKQGPQPARTTRKPLGAIFGQ